ncbi:MAG: RdgB/HAM1 family non-canonical purine NTP pyrophosphatase [Candidatus Magasanikbacteria bacterium]|jgi:XTP/dITP diphosphohydrolase|nr:RdgB/HAM1 family non-canonical purine NTP pyrophosphatase [Candidatus Magasanikbacteria bacterium]
MKLLLGTGNAGKIEELRLPFADLDIELVTLKDFPDIIEPEETGETLLENAVLKAQYYAEQTGLPTLADDGGLFCDALDGWPGVRSARVAPTHETKLALILKELDGVETSKRTATFQGWLAYYDPRCKELYAAYGSCSGHITDEPYESSHMKWGFNHVFYVDEAEKTFAEMSKSEKNSYSHRGKALQKIITYLETTIC